MKYFFTVFATAVIVFLAATLYYKGWPTFVKPGGVSDISTETPVPETTPVPEASLADDNEALITAVRKGLIAEHGQAAEGMTITVSDVEGEYTKGMATGDGGGGIWFAAKLNGTWTLVWDGNGVIDCNSLSPFPEFPQTLIPECLASDSAKLITR